MAEKDRGKTDQCSIASLPNYLSCTACVTLVLKTAVTGDMAFRFIEHCGFWMNNDDVQ